MSNPNEGIERRLDQLIAGQEKLIAGQDTIIAAQETIIEAQKKSNEYLFSKMTTLE